MDDAWGKMKQNVGGKLLALEEHHAIIRNLIEGSDPFDMDDAREALGAYKESLIDSVFSRRKLMTV